MDSQSQQYWIYCLFLVRDNQLLEACYIGQTKNINRRIKEHHSNSRKGKGSFYLHDLAQKSNALIHIAILENLICNRSTIDEREAVWIKSVLDQGFVFPGINNWIMYNNNLDKVKTRINISKTRLLNISVSLTAVIEGNSTISFLEQKY